MNRAKSTEKSVAMKRASSRQWVLKPQDLAVVLKLVTLKSQWLPYAALGEAMHLSRFEAHAAVQRLMAAGLVVDIDDQPSPDRCWQLCANASLSEDFLWLWHSPLKSQKNSFLSLLLRMVA